MLSKLDIEVEPNTDENPSHSSLLASKDKDNNTLRFSPHGQDFERPCSRCLRPGELGLAIGYRDDCFLKRS